MTTKKLTTGKKSTEFWVVGGFFFDLLAKRTGLYEWVSPEQLTTVAGQVEEIARQLRADSGSDSLAVYAIAGLYVVGRILLKWQENSREAL